jgi:MFS family permease
MLTDRLGLPRLRGRRGRPSFVVALTLDMVGTGLFLPVSLLYFTQVSQIPLGIVGWCLSAANLLTLPLPLVVGFVVERIGARWVVTSGLALQGLGFLGYLLVHDAPALFVTALVAAVGQRVFWSSLFTLVADLSSPDERDRWYGLAGAAQAAGVGLGGLAAAGLLASTGTTAYRIVVLANGVTFLAAALLLAVRVPDGEHNDQATPEAAESDGGGGDGARARRTLSRDVPYLALIAVNTVPALCATLMPIGLPVFVTGALSGPDWVVGVLFGVNTLILALAQTSVVRMIGGLRRTRILLASSAAYVVWGLLLVLALGVPAASVVPFLFVVTLMFTIGELLHAPTSSSVAAAASPPGSRGRYLSAFQFSFAIANVVAPAMFAQLFAVDPAAPWLAAAALSVVAGVAMLWLERVLPSAAVRPATQAPARAHDSAEVARR